jgi:sulfatase modifying factor 1
MHARATISLLASLLIQPACAADHSIENLLGMKFVLIPAGEFLMGSDESPELLTTVYPHIERSRFLKLGDEAPVHRVRITRAFYLEQHEVTVGQFRKFLEASSYRPESEADGTGGYGYNPDYDPARSARGDAFEGRDPKYSWRNTGFPQSDDHPVVNVSWNDAVAMAKWLSEKEVKRYRLPTEAEWEYAARAGTRTRYHSGDDPQSLLVVANIFDADAKRNWPKWEAYALAGHDGFAFTAPVGSFAPNAFGLYDMHGNVWEWCADWHDDDYYARSPLDDPRGPASGDVRVRRGGSWHTWPFYARSSYRNWNAPQTRYTLVGFRLVREADEETVEKSAAGKP